MRVQFRWFLLLLAIISIVGATSAQDTPAGALVVGQPGISQITSSGGTVSYTYVLTAISRVNLQALSDSTRPTITILRDGTVIAAQPNSMAASIAQLDIVLEAGVYVIQVGARDGGLGTIMTLIQSESALQILPLPVATLISGEASPENPIILYNFTALNEPAYLYIESLTDGQEISAQLSNLTTGVISATIEHDLSGARLRLPADSSNYRLQITHDGSANRSAYTLCLNTVTGGECGAGAPANQPANPVSTSCTVTPSLNGGTNIRQSASTNAAIVGVLPGGANANVLGIDPFGFWYNVEYNGIIGWAALSALVSNGNCGGISVITPPAIPPTPVPAQPTSIPTSAATPMPAATATPAGPCLISFSAPELIYTQPTADPSYIFDQIPAGGELIPIGRYNAGGQDWWKTNYFGGTWWLNQPGTAGTISGDCSMLPAVSP